MKTLQLERLQQLGANAILAVYDAGQFVRFEPCRLVAGDEYGPPRIRAAYVRS